MRVRTYKVVNHRDNNSNEIINYSISDVHDDDELQKNKRPTIATFPVSQMYDAEEQLSRAEHYMEYLNKIQEAKQTAYNGALLFDTIRKAEEA